MLTPTSIDRLNTVNDFFVEFSTVVSTIGSPTDVISTAQLYMNSVVQTLMLDIIKRN